MTWLNELLIYVAGTAISPVGKVNLVGGAGMTVEASAVDPITGFVSITFEAVLADAGSLQGIPLDLAPDSGTDGYVVTYDDAAGTYILAPASGLTAGTYSGQPISWDGDSWEPASFLSFDSLSDTITGDIRADATFAMHAQNVALDATRVLLGWASDVLTLGDDGNAGAVYRTGTGGEHTFRINNVLTVEIGDGYIAIATDGSVATGGDVRVGKSAFFTGLDDASANANFLVWLADGSNPNGVLTVGNPSSNGTAYTAGDGPHVFYLEGGTVAPFAVSSTEVQRGTEAPIKNMAVPVEQLTQNATPVEVVLFTPGDGVTAFACIVIARERVSTGNDGRKVFRLSGMFERGGGTTFFLDGTATDADPDVSGAGSVATWQAELADDGDNITVIVTGAASTDIDWIILPEWGTYAGQAA